MDNKLLVDINWMDTAQPTITELSRSLDIDTSAFDLDYGIRKPFKDQRIYTIMLPSPVVQDLYSKSHPLLTNTPRPISCSPDEKYNLLKNQERAAPARFRPIKFTPKF